MHDDEPTIFTKKTYKEVKIWDWLGRILPLTVLAVISVLYLLDETDLLTLILEITAISFLVICFIWWYWAIYKIATTVKYMYDAQTKLKEVLNEFRLFKRDLRNEKDTSDR